MNTKERELVDEFRIPYFAAYLQIAYFLCGGLPIEISEGKYPTRDYLTDFNHRTYSESSEFDLVYLKIYGPNDSPILRLEQQAWRLLSPHVRWHVSDFDTFLATYDPPLVTSKEALLLKLTNCRLLHEKWNIISDSFKVKHQNIEEDAEQCERNIRLLIDELPQYQPGQMLQELHIGLPKFRQI